MVGGGWHKCAGFDSWWLGVGTRVSVGRRRRRPGRADARERRKKEREPRDGVGLEEKKMGWLGN